MSKHFMSLIILLFCAGLMPSCTTSSGITIESYPKTKITIYSKMVGNRLQVIEYNARKQNDLLQVQISAQNMTRRDLSFETRFKWLDKDRMTVESPLSIWTPVNISAKETTHIKGIAPAKNVVDFEFIVRFDKSSTRW